MEPTQTPNTPTAPAKKIIIVEDNTALAEIYKTRLELLGYTCFLAYNGITALYFIQKEIPDLVLLDLMVPDIAGDQILQRMRAGNWGKDIPVFIISNLNEEDAPKGLRDLGIAGYAVKMNLKDDDIDNIVNKILRPEAAGGESMASVAPVPVVEAPVAPTPVPGEVPIMSMPGSTPDTVPESAPNPTPDPAPTPASGEHTAEHAVSEEEHL